MNQLTYQRGVGLIEVMVAVLLLSIAILGFSALQVRAVSATDESLVRTKSMTLVRNLAEVMRAYPEAYVTGSGTTFARAKPTDTSAIPTVQAITTSTETDTVTISHEETDALGVTTTVSKTASILAANNCLSKATITDGDGNVVPDQPCNINQLAARDALMVKKQAADEGIKLAVATCPGTAADAIQQQMCVITAWNDTKAEMSADTKACANASGVYNTGSHCLISEAY